MSSPIDTEDWALSITMGWKQAKERESCPSCHGSGKPFRGFGSYDMEDDGDCKTCCGRGSVAYYPKTPKPEVPKELAEIMRKAYNNYWEVFPQQEKL